MEEKDLNELVEILWGYLNLHQNLERADCILALGSNDIRVAERAAQLFFQEYAPLVVFSGGRGRLTPSEWKSSEAEEFARHAQELGVPSDKIWLETKSTNTGENIELTRALFSQKHFDPKRIILVQKPYMTRRAYATFRKFWPEKDVIVTAPELSWNNYPTAGLSKELIINVMVGDLQRIKLYPENGFQIPQEIPLNVWAAYEELVRRGYTSHLVQ